MKLDGIEQKVGGGRILIEFLIGDRRSKKNRRRRRPNWKRLKCGMRENFIRTSGSALHPLSPPLHLFLLLKQKNQIKFGALHTSASIKSPFDAYRRPPTPLSATVKAIATSETSPFSSPLFFLLSSLSFNSFQLKSTSVKLVQATGLAYQSSRLLTSTHQSRLLSAASLGYQSRILVQSTRLCQVISLGYQSSRLDYARLLVQHNFWFGY